MLRYEYRRTTVAAIKDGGNHLKCHVYRFSTGKTIYIVNVDEFTYQVFALKFYPRKYRDSNNKFKVLTKENVALAVLNTCLDIMLAILHQYPAASFGFMGMPNLGEGTAVTKRFRIYGNIARKYLAPDKFDHADISEISAYLLLNKANETPNLREKVDAMFRGIYSDFDDL